MSSQCGGLIHLNCNLGRCWAIRWDSTTGRLVWCKEIITLLGGRLCETKHANYGAKQRIVLLLASARGALGRSKGFGVVVARFARYRTIYELGRSVRGCVCATMTVFLGSPQTKCSGTRFFVK